MKIKNVRLDIQSEDDFISDAKESMKAVAEDKEIKSNAVISFESLKIMRRFITDERLKILKSIRKFHPKSIYALAKLLKRDIENVSDDVHFLSELGLIKIKKIKGRNKTAPVVEYEKILVEISV